jgi:predicted protein tyrosine phosphatase
MSTIYVCPLARLQQTVTETRARYVVTAINPWSIPDTPDGVEPENHLKLAINDINEPRHDLVHPEPRHIEQLIGFARRWNQDGPLVVHCLAGISRSCASAFIIACALSARADEMAIARHLRSASRTAYPNRLMVRHADDLLARNGRMIAAIEALPPPLAALEAKLFSIPSEFKSD